MSLCNKLALPPVTHSRADGIKLWRAIFDSEPPLRIGGTLLQAITIQARQESVIASKYGALEKQLALIRDPSQSVKMPKQSLRVGDRIVRGWGGTNHEVTILPKGFSYRGEVHKSLSEIARLITGARWSGPRFFGIREKRT